MLPPANFCENPVKRCPQPIRRIVVLPLALLGAFGFLINTHVSFIPSAYCPSKTNIVFLKTHKCAGSSIQNILMRFGDSRNLTFVLPKGGNYLGHPTPFNRIFLATPLLPTYNILAHHTRLNYSEIRALMPRDSVFITVIRDPVQIFESSYAYYALNKFYRCSIHKFVRLLPRFSKRFVNRRYQGKFGLNQMSFDLGADPAIFDNETMIESFVDQLENWFDLVLVAERMDESLVLLRHLMCWSVDDVVTFKLNARNPKFKSNLSSDERLRLRDLNRADVRLYNRFVSRFDAQVEAFGRERMAAETVELRERTKQWYDLCVTGEVPLTTPISSKHYYNPRVMAFEPRHNVSNETCRMLTTEELTYTDYLREKQAPVSLVSNKTNAVL